MEQHPYCTVEDALEELRAGRIIVVIDNPDRENEGDMVCAAQFATTENVNFMATHAKGLICTPMSEEIAGRLGDGIYTARYTVPISDSQELQVEVELTETWADYSWRYQVVRWQAAPTGEWESDESLEIWDGT